MRKVFKRAIVVHDPLYPDGKPGVLYALDDMEDERRIALTRSTIHQGHGVSITDGGTDWVLDFNEVWFSKVYQWQGSFTLTKLVHILANMTEAEQSEIMAREETVNAAERKAT